ncbi:MAG TPA: DUF3520 domain-containing protein [Denitromonas sp.]|nr:DUF3520 domain-containing protein [Denitromonas sp.]
MKLYGNSSPHRHSAVATVFLVLMLALATLSALDWLLILEPRLRSEAETTARILAQANAENIQHLMSHGTNPPDTSAIRDALSKMLILEDTQTGESYFSAATMEFTPPFELGSFSIGDTACSDCFDNRIPLFDPVGGKLVGLLTIKVSPVFFQAMRDDTRVSFFVWTAALLGMMGLGWWSLTQLQSRSAQSEARAATLFSASPIPLLLVDTVDGAVIDSNAAARTLFASTASAPARLDDLVGSETRARLESTPADRPLSLETTLRLGNRELPVTTTATTLQLDRKRLLVVAVIDNSAHKAFERRIEEEKEKGVFLTVLGYGMGNYKDAKMEKLADKGNGNFSYIDNLLEAKKVLVNEMSGTLFTIAKDVKIQIEFNPAAVSGYRLIGYENRMLKKEDFNNDKKDAGEIGAGHTVTALYEIIPANADVPPIVDDLKYQKTETAEDLSPGETATVKVRFKKPDGNKSRLVKKIVNTDSFVDFRNVSDDTRFAVTVAAAGMILKKSKEVKLNWDFVVRSAKASKGKDENGYRSEFINLIERSQLISSVK